MASPSLSPISLGTLARIFGATILGFTAGCVLGAPIDTDDEPRDCGSIGSHSEVSADEEGCVCDEGYDWCNDAPGDYTCCEMDRCPGDNNHFDGAIALCVCDVDYEWCDPSDDSDLSCCPISDNTTGDDGGGTGPGTPPPPTCSAEEEGQFWCTHTEEMGPQGSSLYTCSSGEWVIDETTGEESCEFDQYDFSFGCVDTGSAIEFVCGEGPGVGCSDEPAQCSDDDRIQFCKFGKVAEDSCARICQEEGDAEGATYDTGTCSDVEGSKECVCCDFGDEGCASGDTDG